jgi:nitric oxide reductase NorD protein
MALDEYIYGKIYAYLKRKKTTSEENDRTVVLNDIRARITILARALTGNPIEIFPAEREGGYKNNNFFLPISFGLMPTYIENEAYYCFRVLYLSIQQKLQLNGNIKEDLTFENARKIAFEKSDIILKNMFEEYPETEALHQKLKDNIDKQTIKNKTPDYTWLYGKWMQNDIEKNTINELQHFTDKTKIANTLEAKTIVHNKAVEEIINIEVDKKQQEDYVLTHNFEKVDTAEEFDGVWRDFDGEDELENHQNAIDEINMKFTVRVDDTTHSIYQAEFTENTLIADSANAKNNDYYISYNEWNYTKNEYRNNFCKVYPKNCNTTDINYYKNTISNYKSTLLALRKMLTSINNKKQIQLRQKDGNAFDLDALNDMYTDIISKKTPNENVYIDQRKKEKDLSITLLLDISLSSDGYVKGNRVIDVEKEVAILFGEVLHEFDIDFSIQGFYSKTRNYTHCVALKNFDESWNLSKLKIGSIQPEGYTRIGAALRHCASLLQLRKNERKWLILLSDGKPNDYDKYEGKYGIQDVRQALREMQANNINSYGLAIESQAKYYLPQMFGQNHYQILSQPHELLSALVKLYDKIKNH